MVANFHLLKDFQLHAAIYSANSQQVAWPSPWVKGKSHYILIEHNVRIIQLPLEA